MLLHLKDEASFEKEGQKIRLPLEIINTKL